MKFGGTSVEGADRLRAVAELVSVALRDSRVLVVASAMAGVTNTLLQWLRSAAAGDASDFARGFHAQHERELAALRAELGEALAGSCDAVLRELALELAGLLEGTRLLGTCPPTTEARVAVLGERACCALLAALLRARGHDCEELDPRDLIPCEGDPLEARTDAALTRERFSAFRCGDAPLALLPGFFGGDQAGRVMLLGRGGSDLSAALAAAALDAELLEIWTDVAGIFTADPRWVADARRIDTLSYDEAMELAHFGAKVLHPRTLAPVRALDIPVRVRNTFAPTDAGTLVTRKAPLPAHLARGLTLLPEVAMLTVSGPGMPGVPGVAARAFSALAALRINVILITQASSECAISIGVLARHAESAVRALTDEFEVERAAGLVEPVFVRSDLAILSMVGDGMRQRPGVAAALFGALGDLGVNVIAIAQGSSERSISAVVTGAEGVAALPGVHSRFFDTPERLDVYLVGTGLVGRQFLTQLERGAPRWRARGVDLRLRAIANSRRMVIAAAGLEPATALELLGKSVTPCDLPTCQREARERWPAIPVLVDCTSSDAVADEYEAFVAAGFHVVSASKMLNSGPLARYLGLRSALQGHRRRFHYETNVGAGLPVIGPLRDLLSGGDEIQRVEGILSGTLSFVYGQLEEGVPLSVAIARAREAGYTEPDPRVDLSGLDVARKALVLSRELGGTLEREDVQLEGVLPSGFDLSGSVEEFLARLPGADAAMAARVEELRGRGEVLRFVAHVEATCCRVGPQAMALAHPLAAVRGGENAVSICSTAYSPRPMVVRGYGAGAEVTAAGVLADVMRLATGSWA